MPRQHWQTRYWAGRILGVQNDQKAQRLTAADIRKRLYRLLDAPEAQEQGLPGAVTTEYKRCGRARCRCRREQLHGPYYYWQGRMLGVTWKRYLKHADVPRVMALCQLHRERRCTRARTRAMLREFKREMRRLDLALGLTGY